MNSYLALALVLVVTLATAARVPPLVDTAARVPLADTADEPVANVIVGGAGPVGFVFCLRLLEGLEGLDQAPGSGGSLPLVKLYDPILPWRKTVIRIPFSVAKSLPVELREELWPIASVRDTLFGPCSLDDPRFSPRMNYEFWPFIEIFDFQWKVQKYLERHYPKSFEYIKTNSDPTKKFDYPADASTVGMVCTCGFQGNDLRSLYPEDPNLSKESYTPNPGINRRGLLVQFNRHLVEPYRPLISYAEVSKRGLTYAASNNEQKAVQMYVYPKGDMEALFLKATPEMWDTMRGACKQAADVHSDQQCNLNTEATLPSNASAYDVWYHDLRKQIAAKVIEVGAFDAEFNLTDAKLFYASRSEYEYSRVQAYHVLPENDQWMPMLFFGDSAGSTDYAMGLSGGRGLLAASEGADTIVDFVRRGLPLDQAWNGTRVVYQKYWDHVLATEFNQTDPNLEWRADIYQKYFMEGRDIEQTL